MSDIGCSVSTMLRGELGEPYIRPTDNQSLPALSFTRVTVSIDLLTACAAEGLKHLMDAANEFGTRALDPRVYDKEGPR